MHALRYRFRSEATNRVWVPRTPEPSRRGPGSPGVDPALTPSAAKMASMSTATLLFCLTWTISSGQGSQHLGREPAVQDVHEAENRLASHKGTGQHDILTSHVHKRDLGNPSVSGNLLDLVEQPGSQSSVASRNLHPRSSLPGFLKLRSKAKADASAPLQKSEVNEEGHDHIGEAPASGRVEEGSSGGRANPVRRSMSHKKPSGVSSATKLDSGFKNGVLLRVVGSLGGSLMLDYGDAMHELDAIFNPDRRNARADAAIRNEPALERLRRYIAGLRVHMHAGDIQVSDDKGGFQYHLQDEPPKSKKKTHSGGRPMDTSQELTSADLYDVLAGLEGDLPSLPRGPNGGSDIRRDTAAHADYGFEGMSSQDVKDIMEAAYELSGQGPDTFHDAEVKEKVPGYADGQPQKKRPAYNVPAYKKELREAKQLLGDLLVELNKRKSRLVS